MTRRVGCGGKEKVRAHARTAAHIGLCRADECASPPRGGGGFYRAPLHLIALRATSTNRLLLLILAHEQQRRYSLARKGERRLRSFCGCRTTGLCLNLNIARTPTSVARPSAASSSHKTLTALACRARDCRTTSGGDSDSNAINWLLRYIATTNGTGRRLCSRAQSHSSNTQRNLWPRLRLGSGGWLHGP